MTPITAIEDFWGRLAAGTLAELLAPDATWDSPLEGAAAGADVREKAIPVLARWYRETRASEATPARHLRTTAASDGSRVVVEHVLALRDGLVWDQASSKARRAELFELATAVVCEGNRAVRIYFGTWSVTNGEPRMRKGPICRDEGAATRAAIEAMPVVRDYFAALAKGDPAIAGFFEPDGYFREPANNYACGRDQLQEHFQRILDLGGVGVEFLTATTNTERTRIGLELQTVKWGSKTMPVPQAGFASYDLGPHGLLSGARVYDSVVPPVLD